MTGNKHLQQHKSEFQLERMALFSDAVFAIAITLLIIEIKVPDVRDASSPTDVELLNGLVNLIPRFVGFFISFFVIGMYWFVHHQMFAFLKNYNRKLFWANLIFLLSIVFMPFSSNFLSTYFFFSVHVPLAVYTLNIVFSGFMTYRLWKIISNAQHQLSIGLENKTLLRYFYLRAFSVPLVFMLVFLFSFINDWAALFILFFLPAATPMLIRKYYKKKYPQLMETILM